MVTPDTHDGAESLRERYPSGWLALTKHESIPRIVDALLDCHPTASSISRNSPSRPQLSRQSVNRHLDLLLDVGILEPVDRTRPQRYRFDPESDVSQAIIR